MDVKTTPTPSNGSVQKKPVVSHEVLMTFNYDLFKIMGENRNVNLSHVARLIDSYKQKHLISPIIVNEKYEIIDGQHRFTAAIETGLPVYYIKIAGYGIKEVQLLNTNQKNWIKIDYLNSYCSQNMKPYLQFKEFMVRFPDFQIQASERILTLITGSSNDKKMKNGIRKTIKSFEEGELFIPDLHKSYMIAKKIMDFKPFFDGFSRGTFVSAIIPLILNTKVYDHKEMIHKLTTCPIKLVPCLDVMDYRTMLEDIYNYKRQKENKVSFKYE
jgi:hypothetical protein